MRLGVVSDSLAHVHFETRPDVPLGAEGVEIDMGGCQPRQGGPFSTIPPRGRRRFEPA
jgi:hypothetical protein